MSHRYLPRAKFTTADVTTWRPVPLLFRRRIQPMASLTMVPAVRNALKRPDVASVPTEGQVHNRRRYHMETGATSFPATYTTDGQPCCGTCCEEFPKEAWCHVGTYPWPALQPPALAPAVTMKERPAAALGNDQDSRSVVKASTCTRTEEYEQAKE